MYIVIEDLNGKKGSKAYYRKLGQFGFDFVNDKAEATKLNESDVRAILEHAYWYRTQYRALYIGIEE